MDESIPLDTLKEWIRNCGYNGGIPDNKSEAWKLYNRLTKERKPTDRQLEYLFEGLGYRGAKPKTMYDASVLIDRCKAGVAFAPLSPEERRKEWIDERREEFKEQIEEDIAEAKAERNDDYADDFRLVGWKLDFDDDVECSERKNLQGLIYLAQIQVPDIVNHLPPFDSCLFDCHGCQLERVLLDDVPTSGNQYNIQFVKWDLPQFRASVPKHIFKVFDDHKSFSGTQQTPTKTLSVLYALIAFIFRVIYKVVCTLFRFARFSVTQAVEFEKEHKVLQKTASKIADKAKELGLPFVIIGITIAVVLLVLLWLVFCVF